MMQVEPAPLKHPMTSLRGNVLSANGFTSVQDCSVRVSLSSNGVNKRTRTLRCEQVEHTTQTEGQKKRLDRIVRKTFVICEFLKIVHFLFCFLYCLQHQKCETYFFEAWVVKRRQLMKISKSFRFSRVSFMTSWFELPSTKILKLPWLKSL